MRKIITVAIFAMIAQLATNAQAPEAEKEVKWTNSGYFELTGRTGVVEKKRHAGGVESVRESPVNRLKLYANYAWAEELGVKSEEEYIAGIDDEHFLSDRTAWYGRAEFESDDIEELRHRITAATGMGYYFIKEETHKLRGRIGVFGRDEDFRIGDDESTVGVELGVFHKYHINQFGIWTTEVVYTPSLEEQRDYRITYESKLELPFKGLEGFSVEMGVHGEYNNYTPGPTEHYDTYYFIRLKYTW